MKKQIFSLMLSATIFTTNPLFAMDEAEDSEEIGPARTCASCAQKLLPNDTKDEDKGLLFQTFPEETLIYMIAIDPQTIFKFANVSKTSYNLCQDDFVWTSLAEKELVHLNPLQCAKEQVLKYWNVFKTQKIKIKISDVLNPYRWNLMPGQCFIPTRVLGQVGVRAKTSPVTQELGDIFSLLDYYAYVKCEGVYDDSEPEVIVPWNTDYDPVEYDSEYTGPSERKLMRLRKKATHVQLKAFNERSIIETVSKVIPFKVKNPQSKNLLQSDPLQSNKSQSNVNK